MENISARHDLPSPISVTSVFSVYHSNLHRRKRSDKFSYSFTELIYVEEGSAPYTVILDDRTYTLKKGQLLFFPPNSQHYRVTPSDAIVFLIAFDIEFSEMDSLCRCVLTLDGRQRQQLEQVVSMGRSLLESIPQKGYQVGSSLRPRANAFELQKFKNIFELFLIDLYLKETNPISTAIYRFPDERKLDHIISYLKRNIDKQLTLNDISEATFISVAKIRKLFYEKHTCAPMQYFNQLKLGAAIELMCNTPLSYAEIASRLGFSSAAYFSKLFKRKTGMSPTEYIKSLKSCNLDADEPSSDSAK